MMVNTIFYLALFSWLPCVLLYALARLAMKPPRENPAPPAIAGASAGLCLGLLLLGPLADNVPGMMLAVGVAAGIVCLAGLKLSARSVAAAGVALIAGAHLAAAVRKTDAAHDAFWAMPVLDLWVVVGAPVLVALGAVTALKRRLATR